MSGVTGDSRAVFTTRERWKLAVAAEPFHDGRIHAEDVLVDGDRMCVRYTLTCMHESGREIPTSGTKIYTVRDGRIVRIAGHDDGLGVLRQLGIRELE